MSSEGLIRKFWLADAERHFTSAETRMFFALVQMVGGGELVISDAEISANVGVCMATMRKCRARLADAGLIVVTAGNGRGCKTVYRLPGQGDDVPQPVAMEGTVTEVSEVATSESDVVQEVVVPPPTEEVKPKRERTVRPKDGDLFGVKDMRPKRVPPDVSEQPSMDEVVEYCRCKGVDDATAEMFYNHYDSLGWVTSNGVKVKRWQSLVNKWIIRDEKEKQKYGISNNQEGDSYKRSIAARIEQAERKYRESICSP